MRKLLYIVIAIILLAACVGGGEERAILDLAQRIINERPDSALAILDSLEPSSQDFSQKNLRRWQLLRLMAQNKCDTVFRDDSLQKELVKYYDRHGTPNERMVAHYLLGRAYSDMGEAPRALQCFLNAVACADTTSQECDFKTLFRIYGQVAMVYRSQCIPDEELAAWKQYSHFAEKSGDLYSHIRGIEMTIGSYYDKGDTIACLRITEQCRKEYLKHGMIEEAASVFPSAIYIHLLNSNYDKARKMMVMYEKDSGLFDSIGNIKKGRESYYYSKGLYYLGIHQNDSAELLFRKLQEVHLNHDFQANKGLLLLYRNKGLIDSISKYALLFEKSGDDIFNENQAEAVAITQSLYNYNRMERIASEKTLGLERMRIWIWLISFICLVTAISGFVFYQQKERKRNTELGRLSSERMAAIHKYEQLKRELLMMEHDRDTIIEDKKKEIVKLSAQIADYKVRFDNMPDERCEAAMQNDNIVLSFREKAKAKRGNCQPTSSDWSLLKALLQENIPHFYNQVVHNGGLTQQELQTCILCRLGFRTGEIAVLLDTTVQRITNVKISANQNLFGKREASSLSANLKEI